MVYSPGKYVGIKLYAVYSSSVQCIDAGNNCEEKQYLVYSLGKDKEGYRFRVESEDKENRVQREDESCKLRVTADLISVHNNKKLKYKRSKITWLISQLILIEELVN